MMPGNDPVDSFFNSISCVKETFLPLEVGVRKAAKDLEQCWGGTRNKHYGVQLIAQVNEGGKSQICGVKNNKKCGDAKKNGWSMMVNLKAFLDSFSQNSGNVNRGVVSGTWLKEKEVVAKEDESFSSCLQFAVTWSLLVNGFLQALPSPFHSGRKRFQKMDDEYKLCSSLKPTVLSEVKQNGSKGQFARTNWEKRVSEKEGKHVSFECLIGFMHQLSQTLRSLDKGVQEDESGFGQSTLQPLPSSRFCHIKALTNVSEWLKVDVNGFLRNLRFAKVNGVPSGVVELSPSTKEDGDGSATVESKEDTGGCYSQKVATDEFSFPLSNAGHIESTLSTASSIELVQLLLQLRLSSKEHLDKKKLISVLDFFRYTQAKGRRFVEDLDGDDNSSVTLEDLEVAMRKRKLPRKYGHEFMIRTRSHLFSRSVGWKQFFLSMEQNELAILHAYTSLCLINSGTLKKTEILKSLKNARLPANEDKGDAMTQFLNTNTEGSISYGHFQKFMFLLLRNHLQDNPRSILSEAASVAAVQPPGEIPVGSVLRSALAGGLSCSFSCALMHPIDTIKTQVQASTLSFPEIISMLPKIGAKGLYMGSIPAILGQFTSHGLRTGIFEASKLVLINVAPTLPEIQVNSILSFCSTILGTTMRIPSEVLKQRLQAGLYDNVGEALVGTWCQDGLGGFFRGTRATLCREIPFYVAGMGLYDESKKAVQRLLGRQLEPWETIVVGAISGGLAGVTTTPFDVIKTRMMTTQGQSVSMTVVAFSILSQEGPLGLFKGAVPRFFWIAPLGAMNFAGYELARKALNKIAGDQLSQKVTSTE